MTDSMIGVRHYAKTGVTGGTDDDMDSIDASGIVVGSICRVYQAIGSPLTRSVLVYKAEASGDTADGDAVVIPAVPSEYSGDIRWHKYPVPAEIEVVVAEPDEEDMEAGVLYLVVE